MPGPTIQNAVINGVLCYISSARHTYSDQAMISTCLSFYNSEKISNAKEVLYGFTDESCVQRRGEGKTRANLNDIISLMRKLDEDGITIPKFLSDSFDSMPPASGYEILADHIISLLSDMGNLRQEINKFTASHSCPNAEHFSDMKEDIYDVKNILLQKSTLNDNQDLSDGMEKSSFASIVKNVKKMNTNHFKIYYKKFNDVTKGQVVKTDNGEKSSLLEDEEENGTKTIMKTKIIDSGWKRVNRKKGQHTIKGERKGTGGLIGVRQTIDVYVGRCDKSVSVDELKTYIENDIEVQVLGCICLNDNKSDTQMKSFKVTVLLEEREKLLDASKWPENIRVRKFFNPRKNGQFIKEK